MPADSRKGQPWKSFKVRATAAGVKEIKVRRNKIWLTIELDEATMRRLAQAIKSLPEKP